MHTKVSMLAAVLAVVSTAAHAEWELDGSQSSFYYVTNKAAAVSEVNSFTGLSGTITDAGVASLVIDLATVQTNIEIRDQRMRDIVFQVAQHPKAEVSLDVVATTLDTMAAGATVNGTYTAKVTLHGVTAEVPADLQILKLNADTVQVQLAKPLIIAAETFGLTAGVEELRALASLPSITPNAVVDFTLVYKH